MTPPAWHRDALCIEHPDIDYFPSRGEATGPAKAVCGRCLVQRECREYAVDQGIAHGVWGGTSARDRRSLAEEQRAARERDTAPAPKPSRVTLPPVRRGVAALAAVGALGVVSVACGADRDSTASACAALAVYADDVRAGATVEPLQEDLRDASVAARRDGASELAARVVAARVALDKYSEFAALPDSVPKDEAWADVRTRVRHASDLCDD